MANLEKSDRSNRIVLIVLGILAVVTIGATILATTSEWNQTSEPNQQIGEQ